MTSLHNGEARIEQVLRRLYAHADHDAEALRRAREESTRLPSAPTLQQISDLCADAALPVRPEVGRFLYVLVRSRRPTTVVEFGTSFGVSLIYLASALRDNQVGAVIGSEMNRDKVRAARANLEESGLDTYATILEGDARETLTGLPKPIDFLLLDGWKEAYLQMLRQLEPRLAPNAMVVADNLSMLSPEYGEYVRAPANGYVSTSLPLGDGIEVSVFTGRRAR